jgi:hypothetical protein
MEERLNEGRTGFEFYSPMTFKESGSDNSISGTLCLYTDDLSIWFYSLLPFNEIYLPDSLGFVELYLEYAGNASDYYCRIELIDFYENME